MVRFQITLVELLLHTVQPDSFSTGGASSTDGSNGGQFLYNISTDLI